MNTRLVLGEPCICFKEEKAWSPIGQMHLVLEAKRSCPYDQLAGPLREEYLAIGRALGELDPDFGIVNLCCFLKQVGDDDIAGLSCSSVMMGNQSPEHLRTFPRDSAVSFERLWLTNPAIGKQDNRLGECRILSSPLGEGGSVLYTDQLALACEFFNCKGQMVKAEDLADPIRQAGVVFGTLPPPVSGEETNGEVEGHFDQHVDRVASLITDPQGEHHLLVSRYYSMTPSEFREPEQTMEIVRRTCDELHIHLHELARLEIPQSFAVVQRTDKVLMTSGDEEIEEVVKGIVGEENIVTTEIPIVLYPAYAAASIRCLVAEFPAILCND